MTVVIHSKTELVVPKSVRRKAGIKTGDQVEFMVTGRVINIVPKLPFVDDIFSPEEEAQIVKARRESSQSYD